MSNNKEIVVLVDTSRIEGINPYIVTSLVYLVKHELDTMCPYINLTNRINIDTSKYYSNYINNIDNDEREAYNAFIKHLYIMITYTTNKLSGVLNCTYKQKHNYIVLHLQEKQ